MLYTTIFFIEAIKDKESEEDLREVGKNKTGKKALAIVKKKKKSCLQI